MNENEFSNEMQFSFVQSNNREEVIVYTKEYNAKVKAIEKLVKNSYEITGYFEHEIKKLSFFDIDAFAVINEKVYAITEDRNWLVKMRLYELEKLYSDLVYINQSCLGNINKIDHFDVSISGSLKVYFKCGYKDYVSRRQVKKIKERLGVK